MKSLAEFFDMGGYAAFVWPSYVLTFAVIGLEHLLGAPRASRVRASRRAGVSPPRERPA